MEQCLDFASRSFIGLDAMYRHCGWSSSLVLLSLLDYSVRKAAREKDQECRNFGEICEQELKKGKIFNMVKQIVRKNKDVTSCGCVRDKSGKVVTEEEKIRGVWKEYFDKLLNEEFSWDRNS